MKEERVEKFRGLLEMMERYIRHSLGTTEDGTAVLPSMEVETIPILA